MQTGSLPFSGYWNFEPIELLYFDEEVMTYYNSNLDSVSQQLEYQLNNDLLQLARYGSSAIEVITEIELNQDQLTLRHKVLDSLTSDSAPIVQVVYQRVNDSLDLNDSAIASKLIEGNFKFHKPSGKYDIKFLEECSAEVPNLGLAVNLLDDTICYWKLIRFMEIPFLIIDHKESGEKRLIQLTLTQDQIILNFIVPSEL